MHEDSRPRPMNHVLTIVHDLGAVLLGYTHLAR